MIYFVTATDGAVSIAAPPDAYIPQEDGIEKAWHHFIAQEAVRHSWAQGTMEKFNQLHAHLMRWDPCLEFSHLDAVGIIRYVSYLQDDLGLKNSTIQRLLAFLRWFLRWASRNGYPVPADALTPSPKVKILKQKPVFLEWEELMGLFRLEIPPEDSTLRKTRDVFCFCCFTGLRFSDAIGLKRANVGAGEITFTTVKTSRTITVELNRFASAILQRNRKVKDGFALPQMSKQAFNRNIKKVCLLCGLTREVSQEWYQGTRRKSRQRPLWAIVSSHTGRRTFICNALKLGIPPQVVMQWTGHSSYRSMQPYVGVSDATRREAMRSFDKEDGKLL